MDRDRMEQAKKEFLMDLFWNITFTCMAVFVAACLIIGLTGCAEDQNTVVTIEDCSVVQDGDEIVIECPDGSRAIIIEDNTRPPLDIKNKCRWGRHK